MAAKSTNMRYGRVAVTIHWLTALLVIGLLISGSLLEDADAAAKAGILTIHAPVGFLVGLLTVLRIVWWWRFDTRPAPLGNTPDWQEKIAGAVHVLFYVVMLAMVASGIAMMALSGAGDILFGGAPGPLPDFRDYLPRAPHGIGANLMIALIVLHVGAALYHQFMLKDGLMARMR